MTHDTAGAKPLKRMDITLTINGERQRLPGPLTVTALLARLEIPQTKVAVERNLEIVPKSQYGQTTLADGDKLEIVHFIGGG